MSFDCFVVLVVIFQMGPLSLKYVKKCTTQKPFKVFKNLENGRKKFPSIYFLIYNRKDRPSIDGLFLTVL